MNVESAKNGNDEGGSAILNLPVPHFQDIGDCHESEMHALRYNRNA